MNRTDWYFRQRVTNPEMKQFTDFIEDADWKNVKELLGSGILTGGVVKELAVPDSQFVNVEQTIARDSFGRRVNIIDNFGDTVSSIVLGLTLQVDGISVPSTLGTYILFTNAPGVSPFSLVGQQIKLSRSQNGGNNGLFTIQQVVTTDWGGLIPSQIMVRIDEELDEEGYESGLSPRGTSVIAEIASGEDSKANTAFDELNQDIRPINPGNERWVSLYARFDRIKFDTRLDGNGDLIQYIQLENFKYVVDASEAEAVLGTNNRPAKRTNGDLFLADIQHIQGSAIFDAQIDISRQDKMNNLPSLAAQILEYTQVVFHGPKVAWTGTNFQITGDAKLALPRKSFLYNIPQFDIALADGEVVYIEVNRNAVATENCVATKVARGSVPEGSTDKLVFVLADRNGTKIQGPLAGEMEPGQESDIGDSIGEAYLLFTGQGTETTSAPTYSNPRLTGQTNLKNADEKLADDLDDLEADLEAAGVLANQDRNIKMIKGGVYGPSTYSAPNLTLPFSQDIYIHVPGVPEVRNRIAAGSMVFTADGMVAYVEVNRTGTTPAVLAIQYALIEDLSTVNPNIFVLARRMGTDILVGQTFNLKLGEMLELDGALAEINKYFGQLKLTKHETDANKARISGADITLLDGRVLTQELSNLVVKFNGAVINFTTGQIFESDGVTALGVNFTPFVIPATQYAWYGIGIIPSAVAADNTISVQALVTPPSAANANANLAPKPVLAGTKKLGGVLIFNNAGNLEVSQIRQLGTGSGSGGSGVGDLTAVQSELRHALNESDYEWLAECDFRVDTDEMVESGTATFDVANQVYNFPNIGSDLVSENLFNDDFSESFEDALKVEVHAFQDPETPDTAFTAQISEDGLTYESVTMERVANSNHWVGEKELSPAYTTQKEYAVANADNALNLYDPASIDGRAVPFILTSKTAIKNLTVYLNKLGTPSGKLILSIRNNNAGNPGSTIYAQGSVDIASLAAGDVSAVVDLGRIPLPAGTYWIMFEGDSFYKASFVALTHRIGVRTDNSAPTYTDGSSKVLFGGVWSASAQAITFNLTGFIYNLKLKYIAGTADVNLLGFGVLYEKDGIFTEEGEDLFKSFYVDGDANQTVFTLPWYPDKRLQVRDPARSQVHSWPFFTLNGKNVIFPSGTFLDAGNDFFLHFDQTVGSGFDKSNENASLLADNHLGSEDPTNDRSVAGRGILLRRSDGVMREAWIGVGDVWHITDPK